MIRAVVWKELREQGLIAVMLAVLGGALLVAAAAFAEPPAKSAAATDVIASLGAGRLLALMLVVTAGMVCGGALFAAEKEAGTMAFLDTLPAQRGALWRAKLVAGVVLALAVVGALLGAVAALDLGDGPFLRRLVVYAALAFSWGALGSTLARTTLGSVGIAISSATLAAFVFLFPIVVFMSAPGSGGPRPIGWVLFAVLMVAAPLTLSAWLFTAPDRARAADALGDAPTETGVKPNRAPGLGIGALVWLSLRQLRVTGPVLSAFALAFGFALLLPEMRPLFVWPALALTAGVLAGVTAFGDEQSHRTAIFWGEHRLPVGRAWGVKIGIHLGLLTWLLVLLALPGALRGQFDADVRAAFGHTTLSGMFRSRLLVELGSQGWKYALVPAAYGFAFGHVCGLLFRKLVVACGVAAMLGGVAAVGWGPSLLAGGVKHWQVWLPAAAVLLTGRLLVRAWSADRAGDRASVLRLVGAGAFALAAFAVGLAYRIVEVPDDPTGADDTAFVAALPGYDENVAGNKFRSAAERFARTAGLPPPEPSRAPDPRRRQRIDERLELATRHGWPEDDPELSAWLDRVYAERPPTPDEQVWWEQAAEAAAKPIGVYESPALANTAATTAAALDNARKMAVAILARGLQKHAAGDPRAFVPAFRTVVVLARNLRNGGGHLALVVGIEVERIALVAADGWLERRGTPPDQMNALARVATEADDRAPFDPRPHLLSDRFIIRGVMQAPNQWLTGVLDLRGRDPESAAAEADLVALAWAVPWEKERTRRLVGLAPEAAPRPTINALVVGRPGSALIARGRSAADVTDDETHLRVTRRVTILKAAVLAFQTEHKRAPEAPTELVASASLARLPEDPYTEGRPLGYRVSDGQPLVGRARASTPGRPDEPLVVPVQVGQVVVWSVGPDRVDQGGKVPPAGPRAEDLVFLLPAPGAPPK